MLPRVLVLVRGPDNAVHVLLGRQRHGAHHTGTGTGDRFDDLARRGVNGLMVVGLEPDADLLSRHASPTSLLLRTSAGPAGTNPSGLVCPGADRAEICRRCLPVYGPPAPAVGRVALSHTRPLRKNPSRSRLEPDAPMWAPVVCPARKYPAQGNLNSMPQ